MRDGLVRSRTLLLNTVRGWIRTQGQRLPTGSVQTFGARVRALAERDPVAQRLMTVPGVGPVTAVRFVAAVDDRTRFPDAHAVEAYVGLVGGQRSRGDRTRHLGITKAGSPALRSCLVQAAHCAKRTLRPGPLRDWVDAVEHRRGRAIAVVALARKLTGILFALWRDDTRYDPFRTNAAPRAR